MTSRHESNGTGFSKNGFAGDDRPRSIFPTVIGYPSHEAIQTEKDYKKEFYIGHEAIQNRGVLNLSWPLEHGKIKDWEEMRKIWNYTFYKDLKIDPSKHAVILTEAPLNPKKNREEMARIMFEEFNVPALYVGLQAVLSLFASGSDTGCVVDIGDGVTHVAPVAQGYAISDAIQRVELAGRDITEYLKKLLKIADYEFEGKAGIDIVREIKEKVCYVALDFEKEMERSKKVKDIEKDYELPNGEIITLNDERFVAPEVLFNPDLYKKREKPPIDQLIINVIDDCKIDVQKELYANIILSGGSTMFPGLKERLTKSIQEKITKNVDVKIHTPSDRMYSVWLGGSLLGFRKGFFKAAITKHQFIEEGPEVIHQTGI